MVPYATIPIPLYGCSTFAALRRVLLRAVRPGLVHDALEAGVVVMALPCLLAFLLLQRHYVRGFMTGALRG
jgi:ABC-type maltose transport system permease subunit